MVNRLKWILLLFLAVGLGAAACKDDKPRKKSSADATLQKKRTACINSQGRWESNQCVCTGAFTKDPSDINRCIRANTSGNNNQNQQQYYNQQNQNCQAQGMRYNQTEGRCVADGGDPRNIRTYEECDRANYWWNPTDQRCYDKMQTTDINICLRSGDYDPTNQRCQQYNGYEKERRCESRQSTTNARWNSTTGQCDCPNQLVFNWSSLECVPQDQWNQTVMNDEQGCRYSQGTWGNNSCTCNYYSTVWDPRLRRCAPIGGMQPFCPGTWGPHGICWGMSGKQYVFNYLLGWILHDALINSNQP